MKKTIVALFALASLSTGLMAEERKQEASLTVSGFSTYFSNEEAPKDGWEKTNPGLGAEYAWRASHDVFKVNALWFRNSFGRDSQLVGGSWQYSHAFEYVTVDAGLEVFAFNRDNKFNERKWDLGLAPKFTFSTPKMPLSLDVLYVPEVRQDGKQTSTPSAYFLFNYRLK